jgi:hypothetical protein
MNIQMELRKVCGHLFLLEGVEHRETDRYHKELQKSGRLDGSGAGPKGKKEPHAAG